MPERLWALADDAWALVDLVQLRGKRLTAGELERVAAGWVERLGGLSTRVIVNDRIDVALAAGADGAHLGAEDLPIDAAREIVGPGFLLGASTHDRDDLLEAQRAGADYAGLGAFRSTPTKPAARLLDPARDGLAEPLPELSIPVLAIGGLDAGRVGRAFEAPPVTGVAVSGAIQEAEDPGRAIRRLREALDEAWRARQQPGAA